jgi:hypothetical protein
MLYEIHDPSGYILPDVICDWRAVSIKEIGPNRVFVSGARGRAPTAFYKVSATGLDGMKLSAELMFGGIDAKKKAQAVSEAILARTHAALKRHKLNDFDDVNVEFLGAEHSKSSFFCFVLFQTFLLTLTLTLTLIPILILAYGPNGRIDHSREVILRITVLTQEPKALLVFGKELAPAATGMAPGITGAGSGRPRPQPNVRHFSCLVAKDKIPVQIHVASQPQITRIYHGPTSSPKPCEGDCKVQTSWPLLSYDQLIQGHRIIEVPLIAIAYGRSGDKGDVANIGIIGRELRFFPLLKQQVTEEVSNIKTFTTPCFFFVKFHIH